MLDGGQLTAALARSSCSCLPVAVRAPPGCWLARLVVRVALWCLHLAGCCRASGLGRRLRGDLEPPAILERSTTQLMVDPGDQLAVLPLDGVRQGRDWEALGRAKLYSKLAYQALPLSLVVDEAVEAEVQEGGEVLPACLPSSLDVFPTGSESRQLLALVGRCLRRQ